MIPYTQLADALDAWRADRSVGSSSLHGASSPAADADDSAPEIGLNEILDDESVAEEPNDE